MAAASRIASRSAMRFSAAASWFSWASAFNQDISGWDFNSVRSTNGMFRNAISFNRDIRHWDFENVADKTNMFLGASSFEDRTTTECSVGMTLDWSSSGMGFDIQVNPQEVKGNCP